MIRLLFAAALLAPLAAGKGGEQSAAQSTAPATIPLTIAGAGGSHAFKVEVAATPAAQDEALGFLNSL